MKKATLIIATLSHHGPAGEAMVGATIGLAIGVFAGATLHWLVPRLHPLPRGPPSRDDGEPQAGSFSSRLAVDKLPSSPKKVNVSFLATRTIQKGEITMQKKRIRKLLLAGLFVCCAFSANMLGRALATDPVGVTRTVLVGPIPFDPIDIHSFTPTHFAEIETLGLSDLYIVDIKIEPGGHSGWHSHPGVVLVTVISGVATEYHGDDPNCNPIVHPAGTGFTEEAGQVHIVRNEGSTDLEGIVVFLIPSGEPTRIDQPDPGNCP